MKIKLILINIIIVFCLIFVIYKLSTFNLFEVNRKLVSLIKVPSKYEVGLYVLESNATSNECVQVIKTDNEEVIFSIEDFNNVKSYILKNDTLELVLNNDKSDGNHLYTVCLKIP